MLKTALFLSVPAMLLSVGALFGSPTTSVPGSQPSRVATQEHGDSHDHEMAMVDKAVCVLIPVGDSKVVGKLTFAKVDGGIKVSGEVTGLTPGKHGFHVHEFGDVSDLDAGKSTGGHFNPDHKMHGERESDERHAGDFGNIEANADGVAKIDFTDKLITMSGKMSIIGRGIVIHADEDKYTQPTGDAGGRVAIGVIGVAKSAE